MTQATRVDPAHPRSGLGDYATAIEQAAERVERHLSAAATLLDRLEESDDTGTAQCCGLARAELDLALNELRRRNQHPPQWSSAR